MPKTKFYEHASLGSTVKDRFVSDVRRITWAYKLAESTINLPGSAEVPEIQVFEIEAKGDDVAEGVLAAIDKAVRTPIIFEISRGRAADGPSAWSPLTSSSAPVRRSWAPTSAPTGSSIERPSPASDSHRPDEHCTQRCCSR